MKTDKSKRGATAKVVIGSIVLGVAIIAGSLIGKAGKDNAGALSPSFFGPDVTPKVDVKVLEAEYRSDVAAAVAEYKDGVKEADDRFAKALQGECEEGYEKAGAAIHETARKFGEFGRAAKVVRLLAEDKIRKTAKLDAFVGDELSEGFTSPCLEANAKVDAAYRRYCGDLAALTQKLKAELIDDADKFNARMPTPIPLPEAKFDAGKIGALTSKAMQSRVSVVVASGFEAAFIGMTVKSIAALGERVATKAAVSAVAPAADGPLPVGDIIAVGGFIWTCADIYKFKAKVPAELEKSMRESLAEQKETCLKQARENASKLRDEHLEIGAQMEKAALSILN